MVIEPAPPCKSPGGVGAGVELSHFTPVRGEYPAVEEQPAGSPAEGPLVHGTPVVELYPEADVQPAGKFPVGAPINAARVKGPTTPSGDSPFEAWKALTEAAVIGPNLPSCVAPTLPCKHFTSSPTEPTLKVFIIVQSAEAEFTDTAANPTTIIATTITPRRNFDLNNLLI
jgi:hypothetical protein